MESEVYYSYVYYNDCLLLWSITVLDDCKTPFLLVTDSDINKRACNKSKNIQSEGLEIVGIRALHHM